MSRPFRFLLVMLFGLSLITCVASLLVQRTTRKWFEKDLTLRASMAVGGVRRSLISQWSGDHARELADTLEDFSHDQHIIAAAACTLDFTSLAQTKNYPQQFICSALKHSIGDSQSPLLFKEAWQTVESVPNGSIHVCALPLADHGESLGFVVVIQDFSFLRSREAATQKFLLLAFVLLAITASVVTVVARRLAYRDWLTDLRGFFRGGKQRPEFRRVMRNVRDLVDRIIAERESDGESGSWTAQRLKQTLNRYLQGEKIVIVANREPYVHEKIPASNEVKVLHPASGLVTALEPVMRACSGTWIAHGSGSADRETADRYGRVKVPPGEESYSIRRLWLSNEEENGYYYGFSNEGLWPLCHIAHARPVFRSDDWNFYQQVNRKFSDAVLEEVDSEDPIVLVQDYHFALASRLIRDRLPRSTIITYWHIPWPNAQRFGICPWNKELLQGVLGASIVGFQTSSDCNHFMECVDRVLEARIDKEYNAVVQHGHKTLIRHYPISIEWPAHGLSDALSIVDSRRSVFAELGLSADMLLGVGVDRLDYTKGVEERFLAVEKLLEKFPSFVGRFTFVQLAAPSRTFIERYRQLNETVEKLVDTINQRFGNDNYRPIILLRAHHEPATVFRYYRAADLCYVSSLHDGMNLVAKEFVAARDDQNGVLILSQFTGAARELTEALIVNPYDIDEAGSALAAALTMSVTEKRERMRSMRAIIAEFNVYRWAGRMLVEAGRLRSHERLAGRLSDPFSSDREMRQ